MVFARCVSSRIEITRAACQATGLGTLVTVVPLFAPRISVAVISVDFPESGLVVLHESEATYPLGRLPEIEMRHKEASGPPVLGREWLAVILPDNERFSVPHILDPQLARISAIAERHHERSRRFVDPGCGEDAIDGDAAPVGIELRPTRHAVNIHGDLRWTERAKFLPVPRNDVRPVL